MKIKIAILIAMQVVIVLNCFSQFNNIWMLGHAYGPNWSIYYGTDFSNGTPDTFTVNRQMSFFLTNSSICDTAGDLLMYSNGIYIANKLNAPMLNSNYFNPGYFTTYDSLTGLNVAQAVLILPYPGHNNQYIIFHESSDFIDVILPGGAVFHKSAPLNLRYSIVDMSLDGGLGGVIPNKKSIIVINDTLTTGKLTACKHGNGRDWWILAQRYNDSLLYKILVTPDTIEVSTQQTGFPVIYDLLGQAVFSPDGSKYIMVMQYLDVDIFDFDRCDGTLSNYHHIYNLPDTTMGYYGTSISPDNHYLYVNTGMRIYQYDLTNPYIDTTVQTVAVNDLFPNPISSFFRMHSLGPDGKIYICSYDGTYMLHVINQPDSFGLACDVQQHAVTLPGPGGNAAVPTFPNYNLGPLTGSACDTLTSLPSQPKSISNFKIYPNPLTDNLLNIGYQLPQNKGGTFQIYDVTGKVVFKYNLPQWSTLQKFNLHDLSDGVYSCVITSDGYRVSKKMVVIKE